MNRAHQGVRNLIREVWRLKMSMDRRQFLMGASAAAVAASLPEMTLAAGDKIRLGSILDMSGIFDIYGKPMDQATRLAVSEINAAGGLNGKQVEVVSYDTQSDMALYTQYGKKLARRDKVDVVHGGILSASREAIRPTLRRNKVLYFYNVQYEGGVCDRNTFCTGITPAQQAEVLVPAAMKRWGKKAYILAADYNYGQITAKWLTHYLRQNGGDAQQIDFFPLSVADFGTTITKIQQEKPDFIISVLVGGAHMAFYRQWAASGMKAKIPMCSTTLGAGNEQLVLTPEEGNGILVAYSYSQQNQNAENQAFMKKWADTYGDTNVINELAVATYNGVHLWAEGVRRAKSLDRLKVIEALESGVSFQGPTGKVMLDGPTHHAVIDIHLQEFRDQKAVVLESLGQRQPVDTQSVCDLKKNPDDNQQYEIKI